MKKLTTSEEQIMQILWDLEKAFVKDIIAFLPEPKPPYNTVSSVVRILERKGFVSYNAYGHTHEYFPVISRDTYKKFYVKDAVKNYFGNSFQQMVSFFAKEEELTLDELQRLIEKIKSGEQKNND
jgi:predicted transcriptional regulator